MEREKKTFAKSLKRLIFCIIVTLLFGRGVAYCYQGDEFEGPLYEADQSFVKAYPAEGLTLEILEKHEQAFPSPIGRADPHALRSVPVPPAAVTLLVFASAMLVGWLRRRTASDLPR